MDGAPDRRFQPTRRFQRSDGVVIVAGGPSVDPKHLRLCQTVGLKALAINNSHEVAPWADVIYAADWQWWEEHGAKSNVADRWSCLPFTENPTDSAYYQTAYAKIDFTETMLHESMCRVTLFL